MENHIYYLAVNRVGTEGGFRFIGQSKICAPGGQLPQTPCFLNVIPVFDRPGYATICWDCAGCQLQSAPSLAIPLSSTVWADVISQGMRMAISQQPREGAVRALALRDHRLQQSGQQFELSDPLQADETGAVEHSGGFHHAVSWLGRKPGNLPP